VRARVPADGTPLLDRPWRHQRGSFGYALARLRGILHPPVTIVAPAPDLRSRHGVPIPTRDGTVLRASLYTRGANAAPVIVSAQPYGTGRPRPRRRGGWRPDLQYRVMRQPAPITISSETGWEAPDPDWWTGQGYAVLNVELRGSGSSGGRADLMSVQEGRDLYDVIEWAATQDWSTGRVGMLGVSYLAMSQYRAAETRPPSLAAIVPWEGLSDLYRDLMRPGGVTERGFS
jgi:putative CocE/NonD family hydrolase